MTFSSVKSITIPVSGTATEVKSITDADGNVLWSGSQSKEVTVTLNTSWTYSGTYNRFGYYYQLRGVFYVNQTLTLNSISVSLSEGTATVKDFSIAVQSDAPSGAYSRTYTSTGGQQICYFLADGATTTNGYNAYTHSGGSTLGTASQNWFHAHTTSVSVTFNAGGADCTVTMPAFSINATYSNATQIGNPNGSTTETVSVSTSASVNTTATVEV